MTYDIVKKNVYYDPPSEYPFSARNLAQDLREFHQPLQRAHHEALHDRGVAAGLTVQGAPGAGTLTIGAGVAVDGSGQLIILADAGHGNIGNDPAAGDNNEVAVPVSLPLGGMSGKTVYVTIQYSLILRAAEGSGGRLEQVPWLRLQPTTGAGAYVDDGSSIILGIAVVGATGNLTVLKERDVALPFGRYSVGIPAGEVRIRRSLNAGDTVQEAVTGKLRAATGGGIQLAVTDASTGIAIGAESGGNCAAIALNGSSVVCHDGAGREVVHIDADNAWLRVGAAGNEGDIIVHDQNGNPALIFDGSDGRLDIGTTNNPGNLYMRNGNANITMALDGAAGSVNTNLLKPYSGGAIDVNAGFLRVHGNDIVLDGRSGGNKRALVDLGGRLAVNFANDYANGVDVSGLHLSPHIRAMYWEGADTSKRPTYNDWVDLFVFDTNLSINDWDFVTMCEIGMLDSGTTENFWWGASNWSGGNDAGNIRIWWKVNYYDRGDDWRPWIWNITALAFRR